MYDIRTIQVQARPIKAYSYTTTTHDMLYNEDTLYNYNITTITNKNNTLGVAADIYFKYFYIKPFYDTALDYQIHLIMQNKI